jgi:hypothetical protein
LRGNRLPPRGVQKLGSNARWVSFVPKKGAKAFDLRELAADVDEPVVHGFFDDDLGLSMQFHFPDRSGASLDLQLDDGASLGS